MWPSIFVKNHLLLVSGLALPYQQKINVSYGSLKDLLMAF